MSGRSPSDPDTVTLPFVFVPDGEPMPEAVQHFRDPIILRARFEPGSRGSGSQGAEHADPPAAMVPRGIAARIQGAYDVAQNGQTVTGPSEPPGLTPEQERNLVAEARRWVVAGVPYRYGGRSLSGADCSGAVSLIFRAAGMDIGDFSSSSFPNNQSFRKLPADAALRVGDVAWWPGSPGHLAIYAGGLAGEGKDIWTAFNSRGPVFGASSSTYQWGAISGSAPTWYRYVPPAPDR